MSSVVQVTGDIYQIDAQLAAADRPLTSYLIAGSPAALIENGPASAIPAILEALRQVRQEPAQVAFIIPTHIHMDHAGGAGQLARLWPRAQVVFHEQGFRHMVDPTRLIASTKKAFGDNFEDVFGPIVPVAEAQVKVVHGGETLRLGRRELKIIYAPGHAPHHIGIYDSLSRGLFCGEALGLPVGETDYVIPAAIPPGFDLEASLDTYDRLEKLSSSILFYSHDGVSRDVARRIQAVRSSTQRVGELVKAGMEAGEDLAGVCQRVGRGLTEDGLSVAAEQLFPLVAGYVFYFQRRGTERG